MQIENCNLKNGDCSQFEICNLHFAICNLRPTVRSSRRRQGGVYIAVLGSAMIIALLGMCALIGQRIENRMVVASSDIRQAQLNANTAAELGLLTINTNSNWRSQLDANSYLFTNKSTGTGSSCSLKVTDEPADSANPTADRPIKLLGMGYHGPATGAAPRTGAEQRAELVIDPRRQPADYLKQGNSAQPNWQNVFDYYGGPPNGVGTQLDFTQLPNAHPVSNFGQNVDAESNTVNGDPPYWVGDATGTGSAQVSRSNNERHAGNYSLRVRSRSSASAGPSQSVSSFLKPETPYYIQVWVRADGYTNTDLTWRFSLRTKTVADGTSKVSLQATPGQQSGGWLRLSGTLTSNAWSGDLEYAWLTVSCDQVQVWVVDLLIFGHWENRDPDFYMDDFLIKDASTGSFIYKQALGPGYNQLYSNAPTNANGLYWIDCRVNGVNQNLYIERSRIRGTLLILNPGPNSRVDYGPINWSPHIPGYPALLVNGDFSIRATNYPLKEAENGVNYNPQGVTDVTLNWNTNQTDQFTSEIHGLIGVSGILTYKQNPQIRGRVVVGGNGGVPVNNGSPTVTYVPDSLINPPPPSAEFYTYRYERRPASVRKAVLP